MGNTQLHSRFDIDHEGDDYNLVILNMTQSLAGQYSCKIILADIAGHAQLIAISKYKKQQCVSFSYTEVQLKN